MAYDAPRYKTPQTFNLAKATFAADAVKTTAATDIKTGTSSQASDRFEFFRAIKLTEVRATCNVSPDASASTTGDHTYTFQLTDGTTAFATWTFGSAADGDNTAATIASANVDADKPLYVAVAVAGDGTAATHDVGAVTVDIEFQERMA